jgi:hypothetical protein
VNLPVPLLAASGGSRRPSLRARLGDGNASAAKAFAIRYAPGDRPDQYIKKSRFRGKEFLEDKRWKEYRIPDLAYPRLLTLYFSRTKAEEAGLSRTAVDPGRPHISVTALEVALRADDLELLISDPTVRAAVTQNLPNLQPMRDAYGEGDSRLSLGYENGSARRADGTAPMPSLVGFDPSGVCYAITGKVDPGAWLMPVTAKR